MEVYARVYYVSTINYMSGEHGLLKAYGNFKILHDLIDNTYKFPWCFVIEYRRNNGTCMKKGDVFSPHFIQLPSF